MERDAVQTLVQDLGMSDQHGLRDWSWLRSIGLVPRPGLRVAWFNDLIAIPALGITPASLLAPAQARQILRLFSVQPSWAQKSHAGSPTPRTPARSALYPADVGRTVYLRDFVLPVVNAISGEVLPQIAISGSGKLPWNPRQRRHTPRGPAEFGLMRAPEAWMKAEIGRAVQTTGSPGPVPIAILHDSSAPKHAILVQAVPSMIRVRPHVDKDGEPIDCGERVPGLRATDRLAVLQYLAKAFGKANRAPTKLARWATNALPWRHGLSAGTLDGAGLGRLYSYSYDNIGADGSPADFGETCIVKNEASRYDPDHLGDSHANALVLTLRVLREQGLGVDADSAWTRFDQAETLARRRVEDEHGGNLRVSTELLANLDAEHLQHLTRKSVRSSSDITRWLRNSKYVFDAKTHCRLLQTSDTKLRVEAKRWGLNHWRYNRAQLVVRLLHLTN